MLRMRPRVLVLPLLRPSQPAQRVKPHLQPSLPAVWAQRARRRFFCDHTASTGSAQQAAGRLNPTILPPSAGEKESEIKEMTSSSNKKSALPSSGIDPRAWPIAVSALLMGTGIGIVIPVMPLFANSIGISATQLGAVIGVMGATRLLMNIPAAVLAERYGRKPLLVGGPLLTALGMAFTGTASSFSELCGWRFFVGAGGSMQMSGAQLYLADISTPRNRARSMAPMTIAFSAGSLVGPAVGGFLAHSYGLQAPFLFVGAAIIGVALNNMRLPETKPPALLSDGRRRTMREEFAYTAGMWRPLMKNPNVQSCVLVHGGYWVVASGCQFALMPIFAAQHFNFTPSSIGLCFAAMAAVNLAGAQPAAWASDKFGRKAVVLPATMMIATAVATIPFTNSVEMFVGSLLLWAGGATLLGSTPTAYLADVTTDAERPHALALLRSAGDVGLMCGASLLGFIADMSGAVDSAFIAASLVTAAYGAQFMLRATESVVPTVPSGESNLGKIDEKDAVVDK